MRLVCLLLIALTLDVAGQSYSRPEPDSTEIAYRFGVGAGLARIENGEGTRETFLALRFMPEAAQGRLSGGLLLNLRYNIPDLDEREEDFDRVADFVSILRYLSYGNKGEAGWTGRFGELRGERIGYGQIVNLYRNTLSLDDPQRGLRVGFVSPKWRFEGLYSSVIASEMYAARVAYQPAAGRGLRTWSGLSIGVQIAGDLAERGRLVNATVPGAPYFVPEISDVAPGSPVPFGTDEGALRLLSVDLGLPFAQRGGIDYTAYGYVTGIAGHGAGAGLGILGQSDLQGQGFLEARFEQRLLGSEYLPGYFDGLYEIERRRNVDLNLSRIGSVRAFNSKRNELTAQEGPDLGLHLSVDFRIGRRFDGTVSYEGLWTSRNNGWFHADFRTRSPVLPFYAGFVYDRFDVDDPDDLFADESVLRLQLVYRVWKSLMVGFDYAES
ncbi:MAG: hypothetical protein AAGI08_12605, partial [Bacteroidota bacterium]